MHDTVTVSQKNCLRCGHVWLPRSFSVPSCCPKCRTTSWHIPVENKTEEDGDTNGSATRSLDDYFYASGTGITLYQGDAKKVLEVLPEKSIDCIVTSPPYYGQRDYGVDEQIGLEVHPQLFINKLIEVFIEAKRILKPSGSLWVNLGDTYWSGRGVSHSWDNKQKHRRGGRPQDFSGPRPLCTPKQLLLIPHRFAIAMQDIGWILRNDNVWQKKNPTPDPAEDRSASAHEYMFHFVLRRKYYYDFNAVALPSNGARDKKPVPSVWTISTSPSFKKHIAVFPEELVRIPILATVPPEGILLDPFCGSGTALGYAVAQGASRTAIGIDVSTGALEEAKCLLIGDRQITFDDIAQDKT